MRYADYLFSADRIVAELKTLEEDKSADHARKIHALSQDWLKRGLLIGFGRFKISLPKLPPQCQREWLDILESPVENIIRDANAQIRSTKERLRLADHKGLLLIANDGNFLHTEPMNYMTLVARVLKKRKNGLPRFPHIDAVVYFSYRVASKEEGLPFWVPGITEQHDPEVSAFLDRLSNGWGAYLSKVTGRPFAQISRGEFGQRNLTRVRIEINSWIEGDQHMISTNILCQKDDCGQQIELVSDSPETLQWLVCPVHGAIGLFENRAEFEKTIREVVNRTAAQRGLAGIGPDAVLRYGEVGGL
ncbi:MAG TPA: hypothetical protein VFO39_02130 [Candidatus Sulfotelmatobacter sp.]|nr:hypothetical protein [Candidatus Sulfotelmatobacter sp.]